MVSGYLKTQAVDIGSRIGKVEVLAVIDAPREARALDEAASLLVKLSKAQTAQAEARIKTMEGERDAAAAAVKQAESDIDRLVAARRYAQKQLARAKGLVAERAADARLVEEHILQLDTAAAAEHTARLAVTTAKAQHAAAIAKVEQSRADVAEAKAAVERGRSSPGEGPCQCRVHPDRRPVRWRRDPSGLSPGGLRSLGIRGRSGVASDGQANRPDAGARPGSRPRCRHHQCGRPGQRSRSTRSGARLSRELSPGWANPKTPPPGPCASRSTSPTPRGFSAKECTGRRRSYSSRLAQPDRPARVRHGTLGANPRRRLSSSAAGSPRRTQVELGADNGSLVEILSGIKPDDSVVVRSGVPLEDGLAVVETAAPAHAPAIATSSTH